MWLHGKMIVINAHIRLNIMSNVVFANEGSVKQNSRR